MIIVTAHAAERLIERIDGSLTFEQARASIASHSVVIEKAAAFGCRIVKLGTGGRLVLDGLTVVTVLGPQSRFVRDDARRLPWERREAMPLPANGVR